MIRQLILVALFSLILCHRADADDAALQVDLDTTEVPKLASWGEEAKDLILEWHPRISNLIPTKEVKPTTKVFLKIRKSDQGVGGTAGNRISISSHWIEKHPGDVGLVIHELVHVIQAYPSARPVWVTEGIADYLRWAIFEGKPQEWFPRPKEKQAYKKGYRVTAGFLLWLETDISPGIVKRLNTAMRKSEYSDKIFETETGRSLDELWDAYVGS